MSEAVWLELLKQLPLILVGIGTLVTTIISALNHIGIKKGREALAENTALTQAVAVNSNGNTDQIAALSKQLGRSEGVQQEKAAEHDRDVASHMGGS